MVFKTNLNLLNRSIYWLVFWLGFWWVPLFSGNLSQLLIGITLITSIRLSLPMLVQSKSEANIVPVLMSGIFSAFFSGLFWGQTWQGAIQNCDEYICRLFPSFWMIFVYFYGALGGFVGELVYRIIFAPKILDP